MKKFFAMAALALMLTRCGAMKAPFAGMVYTDVQDGMAVTGNAGSSKVGTATVKGYLGLVALGDASIRSACRDAGITRIHHVDYKSVSYVGVYNIYTVIVYGE